MTFLDKSKAIAAGVLGLLNLVNLVLGTQLELSGTTVTVISVALAVLQPVIVYLVPNKGFVKVPTSTETTSPTLTEPAKPAEVIKPTKKAVAEVRRRGNWKNAPKG